jgi:hypothetical protein
MANSSLNDLSGISNTDKSLHASSEIFASLTEEQKPLEKLEAREEPFTFLAKKLEDKIIVLVKKNAMDDWFSYLDCKSMLERFREEFDILFDNLICEWVAHSGILIKDAEGFDLFKAVKKLYISLNKKYSFKLKEATEKARLEYTYAMDDEDPEPGGY